MRKISINELFVLTNIDRRAIGRRLAGIEAEPGPGKALLYQSDAALRLLYAGPDGERLDASQERALLDRERRKALELANSRLEGKLLPVDEVSKAWEEQIAIAKGRFLALPSRLAPRLVRTKAIREVELILRDGIIEVMSELSGGTNEA